MTFPQILIMVPLSPLITIESQNALGWKGPFKGHLVHPPCSKQGHLQIHQVAQSHVQLGRECFQWWGICHLSGQPVPVPHHPLCKKKFFFISNLNLPAFSLKLLPLVLSQQALLKTLSPSFKYWKAARRSPWSLLFSRLNSPNSLSLSSQERCSIPLDVFVALLWTCLIIIIP